MIPPHVARAVGEITGQKPAHAAPIEGGYTAALRLRVTLAGGETVFVKAATLENTAVWLRREAEVYKALAGAAFLPHCFGFRDDEPGPVLVLEDLSGAHWPPPWPEGSVNAVLHALHDLHARAAQISFSLPRLADERAAFQGWQSVAAQPEAFLSSGFCSAAWLQNALPALLAAEESVVLEGNDLLHLDVRSDNICLRPSGQAVLVDWNWVCIGCGTMDIAGWLPSLHAEGGPAPETTLPDAAPYAAALSGFWAAKAGLPPPPGAPRVRDVQKKQLSAALPWAARALGLPLLTENKS